MLRTLSLFFLFALVPVQAAIYFAHNVSEDSGFINTKKYWNGDSVNPKKKKIILSR